MVALNLSLQNTANIEEMSKSTQTDLIIEGITTGVQTRSLALVRFEDSFQLEDKSCQVIVDWQEDVPPPAIETGERCCTLARTDMCSCLFLSALRLFPFVIVKTNFDFIELPLW